MINTLSGIGSVTPLMAAASAGCTSCVQLLLCAAAAPDATRSMRLTALMITAIRGHADCDRSLLRASASVGMCDEDGWSSLLYASVHGHAAGSPGEHGT